MTGIKACPHCGGEGVLTAAYNKKNDNYTVFVRCNICGATGKKYFIKDRPENMDSDYEKIPVCSMAIGAWNLRTPAVGDQADKDPEGVEL